MDVIPFPSRRNPSYAASDIGRTVSRLAFLNSAAIAVFGMLLMGIIYLAGTLANNSAINRDRQQIDNAISKRLGQILLEQKSVAWWDDAVDNLGSSVANLNWIHENFGIYLSQSFGHNEIYILDSIDTPIYAARGQARVSTNAFLRRQPQLEQQIKYLRESIGKPQSKYKDIYELDEDNYPQLRAKNIARASVKLSKIDNEIVALAVMSIVPNRRMEKLKTEPYILISIAKIDIKKVADISSNLLITDLSLSASPATDHNRISQPLIGASGEILRYFSWVPRHPGQTLLIIILPIMGIAVISVFFLARVMENRLRLTAVDLISSQKTAVHMANHDMLSELPNRFQFNNRLKDMLDMTDVSSTGRVAVAYLDIDRFKDVNDTLGHEAGDILIRIVAERLPQALDSNILLARFGGDEFAIAMPLYLSSDISTLGAKILKAFEAPFLLGTQVIQVSTSVGIAISPSHGTSVQELFQKADIALYAAKENGRSQWMVFNAAMAARVQLRREIEQDLRRALNEVGTPQLSLVYQPIIGARDFKMIGAEALIRWSHPTRGNISPAEFIPVAEEAGLMPLLGDWILERAISNAANWPQLEVAINLSPAQFRHSELTVTLHNLVKKYHVDPTKIVLEITEGLLLENSTKIRNTFDALRAIGFKTALDDFGTGYSSLKYLCEFKFDKIKIDQSFVRAATPDGQTMAIIHAVITVGQGFGMAITAEGVETAIQEKLLRIIGCTELQGYRYSRPIPANAIDDLIARGSNLSVAVLT
jgi:diguanylate cyclase (GGDEF)-like protein